MFNYKWNLSDGYPAPGIKKHGLKVFSCFACGGGSTMGYKLAGYDVVGFNEIDPKMAECYIANHNPKHCYIEPIQDFKNRNDLPDELFNLDILDGSPPCSSFSMAGNREKDWGKKKKFREGQQEQILDTLFFDFLDVAEKLQPKVIIAENVKGILMGEAAWFLTKVIEKFESIGYYTGKQLLDSSRMGVPQKRERVFIYAIRKDLLKHIKTYDLFGNEPDLNLSFHEKLIPIKSFAKKVKKRDTQNYSKNRFGDIILNINKPAQTIATINRYWLDEEHLINEESLNLIGSYPVDYRFLNNEKKYLIGMSVPPVMIAQIANNIYKQWFKKIAIHK